MYIVPKRGLPPWESRIRAFNIYSNVWLIYKYQTCNEEIDGAIGTGKQALVEGANTLSVRSTGAASVPVTSTTGHGGTTNYLLTGIAPGTRVHLEAPEYVGEGEERKHFERWSGIQSSTNRSIYFTINDRDANLNITAHYVGDPEKHTLQVRAPEDVEITSTTGHGGVGIYELADIYGGTRVVLEAPVIQEERGKIYVNDDEASSDIWHRPFKGWTGVVENRRITERQISFAMERDMTVEAHYGDWEQVSLPSLPVLEPLLPDYVGERLQEILDEILDAMGLPDPELPLEKYPLHPDFWDPNIFLEPDFFWEELWKEPSIFDDFWTRPGLHDELTKYPNVLEEVSQSPEVWDELLKNTGLWDELLLAPELYLPYLQDGILSPELQLIY